jgi:hypothetical protein
MPVNIKKGRKKRGFLKTTHAGYLTGLKAVVVFLFL